MPTKDELEELLEQLHSNDILAILDRAKIDANGVESTITIKLEPEDFLICLKWLLEKGKRI